MQRPISRLSSSARRLEHVRGLAAICLAALCWVAAGFALADDNLVPYGPFLGGPKALYVIFALVMTIVAAYKARILRRRG